ncbi:TonB-dependent receptor [bacterium]|nr:TonB-dependent receptor [bacterium]
MRQTNVIHLLLLIFTLSASSLQASQPVKGRVYSGETGQPMIAVQILIEGTGLGTVTGNDGRFSINLPAGHYTLIFRYIGFSEHKKRIRVGATRPPAYMTIRMEPSVVMGQTITITAQGENAKTGKYIIPTQAIRDIPAPLPDALMAIKTLPGVFSQNDQSSFYSVRGGSYDDNLILLNGIELYQPHLVRKAVAENPSPVNGALIQSMVLQTGFSPVSQGDKTASILHITYKDSASKINASARATTVIMEAAINGPIGKWAHWMAAARRIDYGYIFKGLRTEGKYNPQYTDFQGQLTLRPFEGQKLKLFGLHAKSRYRALPEAENAQWDPIDKIIFYDFYIDGHEHFDYETSAIRTAWTAQWTPSFTTNIEAFTYKQHESEDAWLKYKVRSPFADTTDAETDSLLIEYNKNVDREEKYNNTLDIHAKNISGDITLRLGDHRIRAGGAIKEITFNDKRYEAVSGSALLITDPLEPINKSGSFKATMTTAWIEHRWQISPLLSMTYGLRGMFTDFNNQQDWMPRWRLDWTFSDQTDIAFSAGRYVQPPLYKELLNKSGEEQAKVRSQKSIQAALSLRHTWNPGYSLKSEIFVKSLTDLISYDLWDVRAVYSGKNDSRGYVYGIDAQLSGPFIPDCHSWVSYQFLIARENIECDNQGWVPRPADQRHTLALNFQDKMVRFPGSRLHVRLILGSGTYFTYRYRVEDDQGNAYLRSGPRNANKLPYYQRFDIGFTQKFKWKGLQITCREEVLNLFNRKNTLGYTWFGHELLKRYLSGRVFNIGAEIIL